MTWAAFKSLVSGQRPVWLYEFTLGGAVERYTPRASAYSYGGNSYSPLAIVKGALPTTGEERRATLELTMPIATGIAQSLVAGIGLQEVGVAILSGDANDPDQEFLTRFAGRVIAPRPFFAEKSWGRIKLLCENRFTAGRRRTMPRVMDRICSHALYRGGCKLNIADWNTAGTATAISGNTLTIAAAAGQADGYYRNGILTYNGHYQAITAHTGNQITLLADVPGLAAQIASLGSASVDIAPGCDKTAAMCDTRFSNILNFGGFPDMTDTPFDGRVLT